MATDDAADDDDLVLFRDVRVMRSTALALVCRIGEQNVRLPRRHISGKLWRTGDRGKLFIRRWVARDRRLIGPVGVASVSFLVPTISPRHLRVHLRLVRKYRTERHAD